LEDNGAVGASWNFDFSGNDLKLLTSSRGKSEIESIQDENGYI